MLRVVLGRARPDSEWSGKVSRLEFTSSQAVRASKPQGDRSAVLEYQEDNRDQNGEIEPPVLKLEA
jgi:hypothetical protein